MVPRDEMLEFTRSFFRGCSDLSTVTHSIVRQKFLTHVRRDHLEPEEKVALKRMVEEELMKLQADAGAREGKLDLIKAKRSPAPCSDSERKRFRFNSESGSPAKNSTTKEKSCWRAFKKAVESTDEEQQTNLGAKMGLEESSEEEVGGSVKSSKVWKEENTEGDADGKKEHKVRAKKKAWAKNKQAPSKSSGKKQVREESESSEEEAMQGRAKVGGQTGAKRHKESEDSDEEPLAKKKEHRQPAKVGGNMDAKHHKESEDSDEEPLANKKEHRQPAKVGGNMDAKCHKESEDSDEEPLANKKEHRQPRPRSNKGERMSYKQKAEVGRPTGGLGDVEEEEREAVSSRDSSGEEGENSSKKSSGRTQPESGRRQSASSDNGEGSSDSDVEREVSDSQAAESTKGERKNRSSKKSSKKGKARSSSSSSDSSPETTRQKAGSRRRGEDHPAVVRLKRYIRACGAHRNYKKLLGSCRSHKERLSILKAELEALGMKGNPSLEKCQALKEQREEAAEVASLDVANIINSSGRSRRSNAWNPSREGNPPGELYRRTLDSEEDRPRQAPPDWSHMRGIISSDGESS